MALFDGFFVKANTILKGALNLTAASAGKDPVRLQEFNARTINGFPLSTDINITSGDIDGIDLIDNTADINKPVSIIQKQALDLKIPFGTITQLKAVTDDTVTSYRIIDQYKFGDFKYDSTDTTTANDDSMTIVVGSRRFKRQYLGVVYPEWFGAIPNGTFNSGTAIQACFNFASANGLDVRFGVGTYVTGNTLALKNLNGGNINNFRITISGSGAGKTILKAVGVAGALMSADSGVNAGVNDNFIIIEKIEFQANGASHCFKSARLVGARFMNNFFLGGNTCGVEIGQSGASENYSLYFYSNYHGGLGTGAVADNLACLKIWSARFLEVHDMETDGGQIGIHLLGNCDKNKIIGGKIEGSKRVAIRIEGGGGGDNTIENVHMNPYAGSSFNGTQSGIEILAATSNAFNKIKGCTLNMLAPTQLPYSISVTGDLSVGAQIVAQTSGTMGVVGYYENGGANVVVNRGGGGSGYQVGETVLQASTGKSAVVTAIRPAVVTGILLNGNSGGNIVTENIIRGLPSYGINNFSDANILTNNQIEAIVGIQTGLDVIIADSNIYSTVNSIVNTNSGATVYYSNNRIVGALSGVVERYIRTAGGTVTGIITFNQNPVISKAFPSLAFADTDSNNKSYLTTKFNIFRMAINRDPDSTTYFDGTKHGAMATLNGTTSSGVFEILTSTIAGGVLSSSFRVEKSSAPTTTTDVSVGFNGSLKPIKPLAADSGGTGFRMLVIPN